MLRKKVIIAVASFALITLLVGQSLSGGQRPQRGGDRPQRGAERPQRGGERPQRGGDQRQMMQRDPQAMQARMQQMMVERMKRQLQIEDDKWETVKPLLENVMKLNNQLNPSARGGMFGGFGGRGGMGAGGRTRPGGAAEPAKTEKTDLQKAVDELQEIVRSENAEDDSIKAKLTAVRTAKAKVKTDLAKAQETLKAQMTVKQEANLVIMGLLN